MGEIQFFVKWGTKKVPILCTSLISCDIFGKIAKIYTSPVVSIDVQGGLVYTNFFLMFISFTNLLFLLFR